MSERLDEISSSRKWHKTLRPRMHQGQRKHRGLQSLKWYARPPPLTVRVEP